jgi:hypothetical protein
MRSLLDQLVELPRSSFVLPCGMRERTQPLFILDATMFFVPFDSQPYAEIDMQLISHSPFGLITARHLNFE